MVISFSQNDNKPKEKLTVSSENTNFPPILSSDSHEQDSSDKLRQRAIAREVCQLNDMKWTAADLCFSHFIIGSAL